MNELNNLKDNLMLDELAVANFLAQEIPPIPGSDQDQWKETARQLVGKNARSFIEYLKIGTLAQQYNALIALRQLGIEAYDIGKPSQSVYEVNFQGERLLIYPDIQQDPELYNFGDELHFKLPLALAFKRQVENMQLTQMQVKERTGMTQAKISAIINGKLNNVSLERLMRALVSLDLNVDITVSPKHPANIVAHVSG